MTSVIKDYLEVFMDLEGNFEFDGASEDRSSDLLACKFQLGIQDLDSSISKSMNGTFTFKNPTGIYSPEHASALSGFKIGTLLMVQTDHAAVVQQQFIGRISKIEPAPGVTGDRTTIVTVDGYFSRLYEILVSIAVQQNVTVDEVVNLIISNAGLYPPGFIGWFVGRRGFSELGETSYLSAGTSEFLDLEIGETTFAYVGDTFANLEVQAALKLLAHNERGWIFFSREGKITFWNRGHFYRDIPSSIDLAITRTQDLEYIFGEEYLSALRGTVRPRTVGSSSEVLAQLNEVTALKFNFTRKTSETSNTTNFILEYEGPEGVEIAAASIDALVPGTDYIVRDKRAIGADIVNDQVTVSVEDEGTQAKVTIINNAGKTLYLHFLQIKGIKITSFKEQVFEEIDEAARLENGFKSGNIDFELIDNVGEVEDFIRWSLESRSTPRGRVDSLTVVANDSSTNLTNLLALTVGDKISVTEPHLGLSAKEYWILGVTHELEDAILHTMSFKLLSPYDTSFWVLGTTELSEIGLTTTLGV